eukprot:PhM_4_TR13888/c2_g1_i1/m.56510
MVASIHEDAASSDECCRVIPANSYVVDHRYNFDAFNVKYGEKYGPRHCLCNVCRKRTPHCNPCQCESVVHCTIPFDWCAYAQHVACESVWVQGEMIIPCFEIELPKKQLPGEFLAVH